jgi:nucleoside-diphosphate-sugar epimerase
MRTAITGGAGFIGSNIAATLASHGHEVVILDNFSTGRAQNLQKIRDDVKVVEGDIRESSVLEEAFAGVEVVYHEAALPSVKRSVEDPLTSHECNATGTLNVLLAARKCSARRVVYAASSSAYGNTPTLPKVESMPAAPLSPYAVSKLTGELYCRVFPALYGVETVALRYFNVFGPNQDPKSHYAAVVPLFITGILAGRTIHIDGDGGQSRDFTYIDNVVQVNLLAATAKGVAGEMFNVGVGKASTINDLVAAIEKITGKKAIVEHGPARPGDVRDSLADISKARKMLGYDPKFDLASGLERTVEYFRKTM